MVTRIETAGSETSEDLDALRQRAQERGDHLFATIFFTPEGYADPIPSYREMHEAAPVHVSAFGGAVLSKYEHCRALLRDSRFGNGDRNANTSAFSASDPDLLAVRQEIADRTAQGAQSMLGLDPPDHTRQRSLVSRAFTPRTVEKLRPRIAAQVDTYLDALEADGGGDLMNALAMPLPVSVISDMLGVPAADWPGIREPVTALVASLEPGASVDELRASIEARDVLVAYFADLIERRTAEPADDLLSALIAARDEQDKLSNAEVLAVSILLFAAGAETTTNLIGNGVNALLNHPDQLELLWNDPSLVPAMVEEVLRFDSPVQLDGRTCLETAEFAGLSFEPGDRVITLLGGANHDPSAFEDPDRFDITRYSDSRATAAEPVMSFGSGIHYCLGANLARVEAQEAFAGLIRRFSSLEAAGDRPYRHRMVLRGLEVCPVKVSGIPR